MSVTVARLEAVLSANTKDFTRKMDESEGRMKSLGAVAGVAGAAIVSGIAIGLDKSIHAAISAQTAQARLQQSFKDAGLSARAYAKGIDALEASGRKLGFTDEDTKNALGSLITATHSYALSVKDLSVAQDLSRFKHVSLTDASRMLTMAMTGSQRAAKQLGISVPPVTSAVDALKASHVNLHTALGASELAQAKLTDKQATGIAVVDAVRDHVKGQAAAFAGTAQGGMAQFHAQLQHIEVAIGTAVLPALVLLITKANEAVVWFEANWPKIRDVIRNVMERLRPIIEPTLNEIKAIFQVIGAAIHGNWSGVWDGVKNIVRDDLAQTKNLIVLAWAGFRAAMSALGAAALAGLRAGLAGVGNLVMSHVINPFIDTIDGAWKAVKGAVTGLFGKVIGWVKGVLGISSPSSVFHSIGQNVVHGFINGVGSMSGVLKTAVVHMVDQAAHSLGTTFGIITPSVSLKDRKGLDHVAKVFGNKALGKAMAKANYGWSGAQFDALDKLWTQESGWSQFAKNSSSGAYGIPQALPPSKMPFAAQEAGGSSPAAQIAWGLSYIHGRYGNPVNAWNFDVSHGMQGYDKGGWLMPGLTLAMNATGQPERVLPPGGGGDIHVHLTNHGVLGSRREVISWLRDAAAQFGARNNRPAFGV